MSSPSIIYLVTRTHGRRTHLLPHESLKAISRSRSLPEIVDHLLRSDYAVNISRIPSEELDSVRLEKIFSEMLVERLFTVTKDARGGVKEFLEAYSARIEVENLKRILRAKHAQEEIEEDDLIPLRREHTLVNFQALTKAENVEEAVSLLRETVYASITNKLDSYRRLGSSIVLESYLDNVYFNRLWEGMERLPGVTGVRRLVGEEVDLRNILLILTLKRREIPSRLAEEMAIPIFYRLSRNVVKSLFQKELIDALEALSGTVYRPVAQELLKSREPTSSIETVASKHLYNDASSALNDMFLELGYVIAYMLLCEREARSLTTVTTALDLGVPEASLQERLLF
ncbi:V-type ATPase subunit [Candidatus Bathyarchaeota archaeon]|nr:V-type ATPase subunit [Candidatus Bathyarchaeota archaeon]